MRNFILRLLLLSAIVSSAFAGDLTVSFWNIQWFPGARPEASAAEQERQVRAVHADIVNIAPDVLGMEEVRDWESAELAVRPLRGFHVDVCSNFPPREGQTVGQQVAIASRLQPVSAWAEEWQAGSTVTPPRGFAFAAYQLAPGQMLLVYAVHLKSNRGERSENIAMREESAKQLLAHIAAMQNAYGKLGRISWIIGGDFNTAPDDRQFAGERTLRMLGEAGFAWCWQNVPFSARVTLPSEGRYPDACFDHVFYRGGILGKAEVVRISKASSDHRAIRALLKY